MDENGTKEKSAYTLNEISGLGIPHVVVFSFELPYLDWCRFSKSEVFHSLTEYLTELGKQSST